MRQRNPFQRAQLICSPKRNADETRNSDFLYYGRHATFNNGANTNDLTNGAQLADILFR